MPYAGDVVNHFLVLPVPDGFHRLRGLAAFGDINFSNALGFLYGKAFSLALIIRKSLAIMQLRYDLYDLRRKIKENMA